MHWAGWGRTAEPVEPVVQLVRLAVGPAAELVVGPVALPAVRLAVRRPAVQLVRLLVRLLEQRPSSWISLGRGWEQEALEWTMWTVGAATAELVAVLAAVAELLPVAAAVAKPVVADVAAVVATEAAAFASAAADAIAVAAEAVAVVVPVLAPVGAAARPALWSSWVPRMFEVRLASQWVES